MGGSQGRDLVEVQAAPQCILSRQSLSNLENFDVKGLRLDTTPFDTVYEPDLKLAVMRTRGVMTPKQAARYDKYRARFRSLLPFHLEGTLRMGQGYDDSVIW